MKFQNLSLSLYHKDEEAHLSYPSSIFFFFPAPSFFHTQYSSQYNIPVQFIVQYTQYSSQYNIPCTVHSTIYLVQFIVQYTQYSSWYNIPITVHGKIYLVQFIVQYTQYSSQYNIPSMQFIVQYTQYSLQYNISSTVHGTIYLVQFIYISFIVQRSSYYISIVSIREIQPLPQTQIFYFLSVSKVYDSGLQRLRD